MIGLLVNGYVRLLHADAWDHARHHSGQTPCPALPKTPEDFYLWSKIFNHDPYFVELTDKLRSKQVARSLCPELSVVEPLWVGDDLADLPRALIGDGAVLKANNGSGRTLLVTGPDFDMEELRERTKSWKDPYGVGLREWAYGGVVPKFMLEPLLTHVDGRHVDECLFYFNKGRCMLVAFRTDMGPGEMRGMLRPMFTGGNDRSRKGWFLPDGTVTKRVGVDDDAELSAFFECASRAVGLAAPLAAGLDNVRVDLYHDGEKYWFGEYTLYPNAGATRHVDAEFRAEQARVWDIRDTWFLTTPQPGWRRLYAGWLRRKLR